MWYCPPGAESEFLFRFCIPLGTLRDWEQGQPGRIAAPAPISPSSPVVGSFLNDFHGVLAYIEVVVDKLGEIIIMVSSCCFED